MKLFEFWLGLVCTPFVTKYYIFNTFALPFFRDDIPIQLFTSLDPFFPYFFRILPGLRQVYGGISGRACCLQSTVLTSAEMLISHNFLFCLSPLSRHHSDIYPLDFVVYFCFLYLPYTWTTLLSIHWTRVRLTWSERTDCQWWCNSVVFTRFCMWHWWCNDKLRPLKWLLCTASDCEMLTNQRT